VGTGVRAGHLYTWALAGLVWHGMAGNRAGRVHGCIWVGFGGMGWDWDRIGMGLDLNGWHGVELAGLGWTKRLGYIDIYGLLLSGFCTCA
jgi:hypothetical protein